MKNLLWNIGGTAKQSTLKLKLQSLLYQEFAKVCVNYLNLISIPIFTIKIIICVCIYIIIISFNTEYLTTYVYLVIHFFTNKTLKMLLSLEKKIANEFSQIVFSL